MKLIHDKRGLSMVEILIALAIMGIISAIIWSGFAEFRRQQVLYSGTETVLSVLNEARGKTLAAKEQIRHGVHFASTTLTVFQGASYDEGAATNRVLTLPAGVVIMNVSVTGGGMDVVFDRLTGKTSQPGTIRVEVATRPEKNRTISITSTGIVGVN